MTQTNSVQLILIVHMPVRQPVNDCGEILFQLEGSRKKIVIIKIADNFDVQGEWGVALKAIRAKYVVALGLERENQIDLKVL